MSNETKGKTVGNANESVTEVTAVTEGTLIEEKVSLPKGAKKFTLPSGGECIIYQGKGRHAIEAHRIIDGDSSLYLPALMAILTTIDGKDLVLEDITEMNLPDYHMIQGNFTESNFTSPQGI